MKKFNLIFTMALLLTAFASTAQTSEIIYIRIQEEISSGAVNLNSYMSVSYPDQTSKMIELEKVGPKGKGVDSNAKKIQKELSSFLFLGYEILSCSVGSDVNLSTTVMILGKRSKK